MRHESSHTNHKQSLEDDYNMLDGWKTYIVGTAAICYALGGLVLGKIDANAALEVVLAAFGGMALRNGIANQ